MDPETHQHDATVKDPEVIGRTMRGTAERFGSFLLGRPMPDLHSLIVQAPSDHPMLAAPPDEFPGLPPKFEDAPLVFDRRINLASGDAAVRLMLFGDRDLKRSFLAEATTAGTALARCNAAHVQGADPRGVTPDDLHIGAWLLFCQQPFLDSPLKNHITIWKVCDSASGKVAYCFTMWSDVFTVSTSVAQLAADAFLGPAAPPGKIEVFPASCKPRNYDRDRFAYEQAIKGATWNQIQTMIQDNKSWLSLDGTGDSVRKAVDAFARREGLEPIAPRRNRNQSEQNRKQSE